MEWIFNFIKQEEKSGEYGDYSIVVALFLAKKIAYNEGSMWTHIIIVQNPPVVGPQVWQFFVNPVPKQAHYVHEGLSCHRRTLGSVARCMYVFVHTQVFQVRTDFP